MLQQAQSGRIGCRECYGSGELALAAIRSNSSRASHIRLTGFSQCSLCVQFAACFAGGVITGFHSVVRNEHSDIALGSHVERSSASPYVEALRTDSELSDCCAECRRGAEHRKCTICQHRTVSSRVRTNRPSKDDYHLQLAG